MIRQRSPLKVPPGAGRREQRWRVAGLCLALAAITFAVFGQTLTHEFVNFDDNGYVYKNPVVARGLTRQGFVWAFSCHAFNWHPLTWLSHMLDCQLYGLNPGGHHLTNVLLHTATVIALFLVLRQMTGALWRSAFVAAVFAIHPLRVESVAWVAERKDVLSGLFFMLTIGAYVRYARRPWSPARYALVLLLFAMGLMCKPMLVTLPVVLLLLDYWPLRRVEPRKLSGLLIEKLPLLALSAVSCAATVSAQTGLIILTDALLLPQRLANTLVTCMVYLGQMIWPAGLAVFYSYSHNGLPSWEVALGGTLLAGLSLVAWRERRKRPWLLVGWLWYLVMLLPVVGIIQVGGQAHADRYTYLPLIGVCVAVTWWAAEWPVGRAAQGGLMTIVLAGLMICAWKQTAYWQNSETLWIHTLACTTDNELAHNDLGKALYQKGDTDAAIAQFQTALKISPNYAKAHYNLGIALFQKRRVDEAIAHLQTAVNIDPHDAEARYNLGLGFFLLDRLDEAIPQYRKALELKPDDAKAHNNLGLIFQKQGRLDEAITQFQQALEIEPDDAKMRHNLGFILQKQGRLDEAITQFQQALQIKPADPAIQNNLAWLLATASQASLRNGGKAVELARRANALTGGENPLFLHTLAAALAEAGQFPEAVETAQRALRLAGAQSNAGLVAQLHSELTLYQTGRPFHGPQ